MNILAIDTSTAKASVAIQKDDEIFSASTDNIYTHAEVILPLIASLLEEAKLVVEDLRYIMYGQGPGSFTGLRVACSVAKGLAMPFDIPLVPVSTLHIISAKASSSQYENILAVIDARMNQLYYRLDNKDYLAAAQDIKVAANTILVGVGFENYQIDNISASYVIYPDAITMLKLFDINNLIKAEDALPLYIRNKVT